MTGIDSREENKKKKRGGEGGLETHLEPQVCLYIYIRFFFFFSLY